jgi:hypothetical protein
MRRIAGGGPVRFQGRGHDPAPACPELPQICTRMAGSDDTMNGRAAIAFFERSGYRLARRKRAKTTNERPF